MALLFFVAPSIHVALQPDVDALRSALAWLGFLAAVQVLGPWGATTSERFFGGFLVGVLAAAVWNAVATWAQWADAERCFGGLVYELTSGRLAGNLRQANHTATLACLGMVAAVELRRRALMSRGALLVGGAFLLTAVWLTESRTAFLNLGVLLLVWALRSAGVSTWLRWQRVALAGGFIAGLAGLIAWVTWQRDTALSSKTILWSRVADLLGQSPWLGHGSGSMAFHNFMNASGMTYPNEVLDNPHNLLFSAMYAWGIPLGAALFVSGAWSVGALVRRTPVADRGWAGQMLLVLAVHSMFEYPLWYGVFQVIVLVALLPGLRAVLGLGQIQGGARVALSGGWMVLTAACTLTLAYHVGLNQLYAGNVSAPVWRFVVAVGEPLSEKYLMYYRAVAEFRHGHCTEASARRLDEVLRRFPEPVVLTRWLACAEEGRLEDNRASVLHAFEFQFPEAFAEWKLSKR